MFYFSKIIGYQYFNDSFWESKIFSEHLQNKSPFNSNWTQTLDKKGFELTLDLLLLFNDISIAIISSNSVTYDKSRIKDYWYKC